MTPDQIVAAAFVIPAAICAIWWLWREIDNWEAGYIDAEVIDDTEWVDPMTLPLSQSRTAQRIRAQMFDHDAEVARFRDELDGWGGAA